MDEFKKGDLCIFIRDSTAAGHHYGEEGEVVTIFQSYGANSSYIYGHKEYSRSGRRRSWTDLDPKDVYKGFPFAYHKDLRKLTTVDVGDLEDDL